MRALGAGAYEAYGCGRTAVYTCIRGHCALDHVTGEDPVATPQDSGDSAPRPEVAQTTLDGRPAVRAVLFERRWRIEIVATQVESAAVEVIPWAENRPCAMLELSAGEERRARFMALRAPNRFRVAIDDLAVVAAADRITIWECGAERRLTSEERDVLVRFLDLVRGGSDAQPGRSSEAQSARAAPVEIRASLDARRAAILACTGGAAVAVRVTWDGTGSASVTLAPPFTGTPEEECARVAIGALTTPTGAPGQLLHPLAP